MLQETLWQQGEKDDLVADLENILHQSIENRLKEVNTCLPGQIVAFYAKEQTVDVQPCISRLFIQGVVLPLPTCLRVPLIYPGGGGFALTFPLREGDECLLLFAQRAIDHWLAQGGVQVPESYRMHSLSDAFALPGLKNSRRVFKDIDLEACTLRSEDGKTFLSLGKNQVTVKSDSITLEGSVKVSGDLTLTEGDISTQGISLTRHIHGGVQPGAGQTTMPIPMEMGY